MNNVINQILAGLLTLAITLITAATVIPVEAWDDPFVLWQFGALAVSSITAIFLPLTKKGVWAGAFKTGAAAILAGIGALLPLLNGIFGIAQWLIVILAVLNTVAIELGVIARVQGAKAIVLAPNVATEIASEGDPRATTAAVHELEVAESPDASKLGR